MTPDETLSVYQRHPAAEAARDCPAVMQTLAPEGPRQFAHLRDALEALVPNSTPAPLPPRR
jgi:hypothetical protein